MQVFSSCSDRGGIAVALTVEFNRGGGVRRRLSRGGGSGGGL